MTPCPDLDRLVDDAVAGLPGAAERLAEHADACAACLAESDCEHAPVPELALLAEAHCPPDVIAAALAAAHRTDAHRPARLASDRPAAQPASRPSARPVWARRAVAGLAFAAALFVLRAAWPTHRAEAPRMAATPAATPTLPATPRPLGPDAALPQPIEIAAVPPPPAPAIQAAPQVAPQIAAPPPASVAQTDVPPVTAPPAIVPPEMSTDVPVDDLASLTPADSVAARSDLLLALAIVGRAQRTADDAVTAEIRRLSDALEPARTL